MAKLLKLRRGTTTQHGSFTGAEGEVTVDTTKDTAVVHDGSTAGGHPLARQDLSNVTANTVKTLINSATDSNTFTDADHTKLNGIETGATADQSASEIVSLISSQTIAPTTVNEASSKLTDGGIIEQRLIGILTFSACGPFETTLSPILKPLVASPLSTTMPAFA